MGIATRPMPPVGAAVGTVDVIEVVVAGCHGGAGTSTVARLIDAAGGGSVTAWDLGVGLPRPAGRPAVQVTRGTPEAVLRATRMIAETERYGLVPPVLAVVGDGPWPEPREARVRLRLLADVVPAVVRIPYVPRWRYLDEPAVHHPPAAVGRALRLLLAALAAAAEHTSHREFR